MVRGKHIATIPMDAVTDLPADSPTPDQHAERREMAERVLDEIARLPEHKRPVVELFYLDGLSQVEIAEVLGVPLTTVNNRLYSSRRRLRCAPQLTEYASIEPVRQKKEKLMQLTYETTTRKLIKGDSAVTIRRMTATDIPAVRRLDGEIDAGLDFSNAQLPPGQEDGPGGPWSEDEWLKQHFEMYERSGNITLLAADESGKLVAMADLWAGHEPQPFGESLDIGYLGFLWEYYHLGIDIVLMEEAEKVARAAGIPALDIGTNTSMGYYPVLRRFGMKVFYECDRVWCKCKAPAGWKPSYHVLEPDPDHGIKKGLLKVNHWSPTDFDHIYEPGRPGMHEFTVDGHRVIADFWRLWEPGQDAPIDCELFAPPEALTSPELMNKILRETAFIAGELGTQEIPLPIPCDMAIDPTLVIVNRREFSYAWMRKVLG